MLFAIQRPPRKPEAILPAITSMLTHWKYLKYVLRHKWFVLVAGRRFRAPLWRLIIHDWSKFLPSEWGSYANYFYNKSAKDIEALEAISRFGLGESAPWGFYIKDRFSNAWLLHQRRNKHYWQYWYLINDTDGEYALPMPES